MALRSSSRYRNSRLLIDEGNLRLDRNTTYFGDYTPVRFQPRNDNSNHIVRAGESLDHISTGYYFDPELFWVIADFQPVPILSPLEPIEPGRILVIPSLDFVRSSILRI